MKIRTNRPLDPSAEVLPISLADRCVAALLSAVVLAAGVVGFVCGSDRVLVMFGHLWSTQKPRQPVVTAMLWIAFISRLQAFIQTVAWAGL